MTTLAAARDALSAAGEVRRAAEGDHARATGHGLAQQAAGISQFVGRVEVKGDFGHFALAVLNKYCNNKPTGRPVAPLAAPLFQAEPAMSKCAQG